MSSQPFTTTNSTIKELYDSYKRKELELSPKFQRRHVWDYKAKSYLIDTLLRGLPIPLIFIREQINAQENSFLLQKEVVDGQQRLNAIFNFIDNGFAISKVHNEIYGDKKFKDLPIDVQTDFFEYPISIVRLRGKTDNEISDIFARLNAYSVVINTQEFLHSQFFGEYKQTVDHLSEEYRTFFLESGLVTPHGVARMKDRQIITEILDPIVENKFRSFTKDSLKPVYSKFDDEFDRRDEITRNVEKTIDLLCLAYDGNAQDTAFTSIPIFVSTILAMYHLNWPLDCIECESCSLDASRISELKTGLDEVERICSLDENLIESKDNLMFLDAIKRQTTNPNKKKLRAEFIGNTLRKYL